MGLYLVADEHETDGGVPKDRSIQAATFPVQCM
jgi:hypothetical protein